MGPARPLPSPLSLSRARAGGVSRPAGPVGRDGRLAPHRDGAPALARAPSRVHRALQRAKNGQRPTERRLRVASDAPIENRAGAAFAHGDAGAARHVRDDRRGRYAGNPFEPRARSNRANPPWTRHGRKRRAPHRTHTSAQEPRVCAKRAVPRFPTFHAFSTSISAFRETRDCAARRKTLEAGLEKSLFLFLEKKKRNLPSSGFGFSARNGRTRVRVFGAFSKTHPTRFFFPGGKKRLR